MPTDITATSSQSFYGYQTNNSVGQTYETQPNGNSTLEMGGMGKNPQNAPSAVPTAGLYHHHHHHHTSHQSNQQTINNGTTPTYLQPGNTLLHTDLTLGADYRESLSAAAKVINNFETKNPIKYPPSVSASRSSTSGNGATNYYKNDYQYPSHHPPPAASYGIYPHPPTNGIKTSHHPYELHGHHPRMAQRSSHHFPSGNLPPSFFVDDPHQTSLQNRGFYSTRTAAYHPSHPPMPPPHHPTPHQYGNYYNNYNHPSVIPTYSSYPPQMPYAATPATMRNESCSKSTPNYNKTGAMALSPVEHATFSLPPSHGFAKSFTENPYYYELSPCAKKPNIQNYSDHPSMMHHQSNGSVMRNASYQQMPKPSHYNNTTNSGYPMPNEGLSSCDYQTYNYRYKNGDISAGAKVAKAPPMMSAKQFKSFNHFEPPHPPTHHPYAAAPQYHTLQVKHPGDKIKFSIDLEEQINSSKIPKMREPTPYGYDIHYPSYYSYHHRAPRSSNATSESDKIANINISLRDFLSTWNEIDDEDESRPSQNGIVLEDLNEHIERTIMREYNPMFVQKATDNIISNGTVENERAPIEASTQVESEKLYVLVEDVPIAEIGKYKHLSIINKLPENVVAITSDKELFTDIEMNRYKSEFELEFEACEERKISKVEDNNIPTVEIKSSESETEEEEMKNESDVKNELSPLPPPTSTSPSEKQQKKKAPKVKTKPEKAQKETILKLKKEKILKVSKDLRKSSRIPKRIPKYSLNRRTSSVKSLQLICVDLLNTSHYRNYAREQLSISKKFSKMKVLKDFKKKFNFEGMKKPPPVINQKSNHSRGRLTSSGIFKVQSLKELCTNLLSSMNVSIVDLFTPPSLKDLCESFIYSNRQYFHIEEVSAVPKLQDLCKNTLSATNIFINLDDANNVYALSEESNVAADEPIYIVEESSGNVGELFETDTLNQDEKCELMRKIQRATASIEDDDEIIRAIGALHDEEEDDDDNNNSDEVFNKNIIDYLDDGDDLFQAIQYEEIISVNSGNSRGEKMKKIVEILRHKYLNRPNVRQACRTFQRIMHKSLNYQRVRKFHNERRKTRINELLQQARNAMCKLRRASNCDNIKGEEEHESDEVVMEPLVVDNVNVIESREEDEKEIENLPKLPIIFPSINEYKIEQKGNHQHIITNYQNNDNNKDDRRRFVEAKKRKMSFDESLLNINKMYRKRSENSNEKSTTNHRDDHRSSSRRSRHHRHHHHHRHEDKSRSRRRSRSRHRRSRKESSDDRSSSQKSHHHNNNTNNNNNNISSSRYDRRDQNNKHSEARRLIIPSYKLYDKDLDVKLKVRPYVRIEREEHVDDLVKKVQLN
jgi:hypothetical protein